MFNIIKQLKSLFMWLMISKFTVVDWYPTTPETTGVPARVNTTEAASIASFEEYDNSELEVISIAKGRTPFLNTLMNLWRGLNGGNYSTMWMNEMISDNFPEFKWKERDEFNDVFTVNGTVNSSATTLVLDSTAWLYAGLLLRDVETNEQIRITSVESGTSMTIQRWVGTVSADTITDDDTLIVLSSAAAKGTSSSSSFFVANQDRSNFFQKFLTTASIEDFDVLAYKIQGWENLIAEKTIQHALEIEKAAMFGQKKSSSDPVTGKPFYTMEWVIENCLRGWTDDISSSLTRATLEWALKNPLKYTKDGSYKKIVLCGSKVRGAISELFENRLMTTQISAIDLTFQSIKINQWEFIFIEHPMLDETSGYENIAFILDPSFLKIVYPQGKNPVDSAGMNGKTRLIINQATKTFAYAEFSLVTYMSLMASNSSAFAAIKVVA